MGLVRRGVTILETTERGSIHEHRHEQRSHRFASLFEDEAAPFDRRYWTTHCEGHRVEFPGGTHGYVEAVRHQDDPDRAAALLVRVGALGRRVVVVPVEDIQFVVPRAERIWLKTPVEIERTERAHR